MEMKLILKLLKVSIFLMPFLVCGQEWTKLETLNIKMNPTAYSVDIQGNFYLGFEDGRLTKYNGDGEELQTFSLSNQSSISLIEAQNNLKLFIFNFDNQKISYLDRLSSIPKSYPLSDYSTDLVMIACPTPDGNLWVAENNPRRLKRIDLLRKNTLFEVQTSLGDSIKFMRTYQNLLIIADEKGIQVFDQFGIKEHSLIISGITFFQLVGDKLLFSASNTAYLYDPFNGVVDKKFALPEVDTKVIIRLKEKYLLIGADISFYSKK
jgi:hypothetical protein